MYSLQIDQPLLPRSTLNYNNLPADQDTTIKVSGSVKMEEIEKGGKAAFLLHCLCFLLSIKQTQINNRQSPLLLLLAYFQIIQMPIGTTIYFATT